MSRRVILVAVMCAAVVGIVAGRAHAQAPIGPGERFVLTGVVFVEGDRGLAWLQEPDLTKNQVVGVRVGDSVGPYRLTKILENQVELQGPGGTVSVPLAGSPGAVSVASSRGASERPAVELPPGPALKNPEAGVIPRGDPRRNFPASSLLIGAGARVGEARSQAPQPSPSEPPAGSRAVVRPLPARVQTPPPELPPHPALNNPQAVVIPRGEFPASSLLIGAGARVGAGR